MKNNFKVLFLTFFTIGIVYIIEFYVLENYFVQQFWCVEVVRDFKIYSFIDIHLPIHCDEGPYQFAIVSIENFFNNTNPYQGRPLFILVLSLFNNLISLEHTHPPSSFVIYENRNKFQKIIKRRWFEILKK